MAYVSSTVRVGYDPKAQGLIARLLLALQRRRLYRQTYGELNALSTRELDDLGINRSMITRLAYEAAYGK
jgi:uncharacterized protein YjiS (DUF1127 family)